MHNLDATMAAVGAEKRFGRRLTGLQTGDQIDDFFFSSTLRILYRVAERFHESFAEGGWNFHVIPVVPGH
jgi:hypothetical protein